MTIKAEIRSKVIEMARQNQGRNRIAHELGIGQGTVSAILQKWRASNSAPPPATPQSEASQSHANDIHSNASGAEQDNSTISIGIDLNKISPPSLKSQDVGVGLASNPTNPRPQPRDGGPLSHLVLETDDQLGEVSDARYEHMTIPKDVNIAAIPTIERTIDKTSTIKTKNETERLYRYHPKSSSSTPSYSSRRSENNRGKEGQDQEENIDLGIDWDSLSSRRHQKRDWNFLSLQESDLDENWESNFWVRIMQEKELRRQEIDWMSEERQELQQMREWLEEQKINLKNREAKVAEIESLAPSVKQLQRMGVDFSLMQSYILLVNERSVLGNIDTRQAALFLSHEFKQLKNLGGILKKIQESKQELSRFGEQKQKALTVLMSLMDKGITESQIALLATDCWHQRQYQQSNGNIQQSSDNNGYGGDNYTMTDYLRLNLLKGSTTNMLNKMTPR